jgi:hypothetical protein
MSTQTDDDRQPPAEVGHVPRVGPIEPNPALLDGVLGVGARPEHPIRHSGQMPAVLLEAPGEQLSLVHVTSSVSLPSSWTKRDASSVTGGG